MSDQTVQQVPYRCSRCKESAQAEAALGTMHIIQNSIPVRYDRRVRVVPCSPDRVPRLPVEILYLIAQALPRPKWVYNLARVNKQSWYCLQPALFQCEVTYEARLKENLGIGDENTSEDWWIGWPDDDDGCMCRCESTIAIEKVAFQAADWNYPLKKQAMNSDVTALHWACMKGADGVPAGLKAIRSASVHQPSYIDGIGLILRHGRVLPVEDISLREEESWFGLSGEIPPPLFLSVVFGNAELCEALIEAGCNVNLLRPEEPDFRLLQFGGHAEEPREPVVLAKIHSDCGTEESACQWHDTHFGHCQTVGHVALNHGRSDMLESLLEGGLDPCLGPTSLIHMAVTHSDAVAVKILLSRYPGLSKLPWGMDSHTPLHLLHHIDLEEENPQPSILLAIARCLVQSGADMEAEAHERGYFQDSFRWGTPLQLSLQVANFRGSEEQGIRAAEALITLGSVWNKPLRPSMPHKSMLDHCIRRATISGSRSRRWFWYVGQEEYELERRLRYTLLVRAMVKTTFNYGPGRGRIIPGAEIRKAFLDAFNTLAIQSVPLPTQHDAFATEIVGKLLLSTGIAPDASVVSSWTQSMRKIQGWTAETPSGRKRSLWEDIMSGRRISHQEVKDIFPPEQEI